MTNYVTIPDTDIDQDSPVTVTLMTALRDNSIAISEGTSGAPKIQGIALENIFLGALDTNGTSGSGFTGLDSEKDILINGAFKPASTSTGIEIRFTNDNGSSWGSYQSVVSNSQSTITNFSIKFDLVSGAYYSFIGENTAGSPNSLNGTLTVPANTNGFQIRGTQSTSVIRSFCFVIGGRA